MAIDDLLSLIPFVNSKSSKKFKHRNVSSSVSLSDTVEASIPLKYVHEGIIVLGDGRYRAIGAINAINFNGMDKDDQKAVLSSFEDYLNSIVNDVQINIPSFTLDIRDHIDVLESRLEEEEDENIREWLLDDIALQKQLIEENEVVDTQYFMVFSVNYKKGSIHYNDITKAKRDLSRMIKLASDDLCGIGLNLTQLHKEEIGKAYYYGFNPFSAGIQDPDFSENEIIYSESYTNKKFVPKQKIDEEGSSFEIKNVDTNHLKKGGMSFIQKICPYSINDYVDPNYIIVGSAYMTCYEVYDYKTFLPPQWAKKLYKLRTNIDISMHISPIRSSEVSSELDKAAINYGAASIDIKSGQKAQGHTSLEKRMAKTSDSIETAMDKLDSGEESYFHYSLTIMAKAKSLLELEDVCSELENTLGSMRVLFRKTSENMKNALFTVLPFGLNKLGSGRSMLTSGIANAFPFTNFNFSHKSGISLGINKYNQNFVTPDFWELENANGVILGCSGAGKTTVLYKLIEQFTVVKKFPVNVIDFEGEQVKKRFINNKETSFAESVSGKIYDFHVSGKHKINIFDVEPDDEVDSLIKPVINYLKIYLNLLMPDLENSDRNKLDFSLIYLFNKFGFYDDKDTYFDLKRKDDKSSILVFGKPKRIPPTLFDLHNIWFEEPEELKKVVGSTKHLAIHLREWTRLGSCDLLDGLSNIDFSYKANFFNLKNLDDYVKVPALAALSYKMWDETRKNPHMEKVNVYDEAHILFLLDQIGKLVFDSTKRVRKYGGSNIFSTQNVTDAINSKWGHAIIKNSSWSLLLRQHKDDAKILGEMYEMTTSEAVKMTTFNRNKGEAYLVADNNRIPINIKLSDKMYDITTTKTKDLKRQEREKIEYLQQQNHF